MRNLSTIFSFVAISALSIACVTEMDDQLERAGEENFAIAEQALVTTNLLDNPGFEGGCTPTWVFVHSTSPCSLVNSPTHSGAMAATRNIQFGRSAVSQRVPATAGTRYEASTWLLTSSGSTSGCYVTIAFTNSAGTQIGTPVSGARSVADTWTQKVVSATAPTGTANATIVVNCAFGYAQNGSGTAYIDDLQLGPAQP